MTGTRKGSVTYVTVSIPKAIANEIDELMQGLGYWPSRGAFVREARLEKVRLEIKRAQDRGEAAGET